MAGDWIKMRVDLYRDPKVCMIADILMADDGELAKHVNQIKQRDMTVTRNVMRNVTVGALVTVWGVIRLRGKRLNDDLTLRGVSLSVIDDLSEVPGFGVAMRKVGWVEESEDGIVFPHFFEEYNVDPNEDAKAKNAERQRRFREKSNVKSNVTDNVTVALESNDREEKRREEKINTVGSAKRRTQMPLNFFPDETGLKSAADKGVRVDLELQKFKDFHAGKGSVMLDWQAAWRTWCSNAKQFVPRFTPDPIAVTVPSRPGVDPALAKCIADSLVCKGPPPNIRSRMKQLQGARP